MNRENHTEGVVGSLFLVDNPDTIRVGSCFMAGRIKQGDIVLCLKHSGDCFQDYGFISVSTNAIRLLKEPTFGSYGIGDSIKIPISDQVFRELLTYKIVYGTLKKEYVFTPSGDN